MDWLHILELAKHGNPQAIAVLINQALPWQQTKALSVKTDDVLKIYLASNQPLPRIEVLNFLKQGIDKLELQQIVQIRIFNLNPARNRLFWEDTFYLLISSVAINNNLLPAVHQSEVESNYHKSISKSITPVLPNNVISLERAVELPPSQINRSAYNSINIPENNKGLFKYLQDNLSVLVISTSIITFNISLVFSWHLLTNPSISWSLPDLFVRGNNDSIQDIESNGETRSIQKSDNFRQAVNQAMEAAILTQTARSKQEWEIVTQTWTKAIDLLELIPRDDINYDRASVKILEYRKNLNYSQERIQYSFVPLVLKQTIPGKISPKSIVHSGHGLFFAQNMMYSHTITVYNRSFQLVKTIPDTVKMSHFNITGYTGTHQGSPVEATFSHQGQYAWISNYQMYGQGFRNPGDDVCSPSQKHDQSFVYRIHTGSLEIDQVIKVGAVPKYLAATPNDRLVVVSNWCSWDISIIDTTLNQEIKRISLGRYPRGIAIDSKSQLAYVAVMGSQDIAVVNLKNWHISWIRGVGAAPRHLVIDPSDQFLYVTLNSEGKVAKLDLLTNKIIAKTSTGNAPRSMAISKDGIFLYVVNYHSNSLSQILARTMQVRQTVRTNPSPIGVTVDADTQQIWVACYSGSLQIFQK